MRHDDDARSENPLVQYDGGQRGLGIGQPQPLRALGAGADRRREQLDRHLSGPRRRDVDRAQLRVAEPRDHDAQPADDRSPSDQRPDPRARRVERVIPREVALGALEPASGERAVESRQYQSLGSLLHGMEDRSASRAR